MVASALLPALIVQAALRLFDPAAMSPETEIVWVSLAQGVNPHLALAVAQAETGNIPEKDGRRNRVVSLGNYGRFQVNCRTWREILGLKSCEELLDRHLNIRAGISILAYVQKNRGARLEGPVGWVAHYNEGVLVSSGGPGERYARRVNVLMRRRYQQAQKRFASFRGW